MVQELAKPTIGAAIGLVGYMFSGEIKQIIKYVYDKFIDIFYSALIINTETNPKLKYAIIQELSKLKHRKLMAEDGLNYTILNGQYRINSVIIIVTDDKIELWSNSLDLDGLKKFLIDLYQKHTVEDKIITFYLLESKKWSYPLYRRPRKMPKPTVDMKKMLKDVKIFLNQKTEQYFAEKGWAYRKGYLIEGPSGTGKTSMAEILANKYNMDVYIVNFNDKKINDTILISRLAQVPPRSIILIDEIEKQWEATKQITSGGLLASLDGAQRLSHSTIIILITNDFSKVDPDLKNKLLRSGRIDNKFKFNITYQ